MRILLTNDDGINAPGIVALHDALADTHGLFGGPLSTPGSADDKSIIYPIAPLTVQSATGHGVTFHQPLMSSQVKVNDRMEGIAVDARPADCVKVAISSIWPERFGKGGRPDLVISGMNAGANCGINVIYSGTVAAALEAAFLGVPSIAVSLHIGRGRTLFDVAAGHARRAVEAVIAAGLPSAHECISINIPVTEDIAFPGEPTPAITDTEELPAATAGAYDPLVMPPIRVCPMNTHALIDKYERRLSPAGNAYYWATGDGYGLDFLAIEKDSDVDLLLRRHITVTPLWYDLTEHRSLARWKERLG